MAPHPVIQRRQAERRALLDRAAAFVGSLPPALGLRAAVVVGSVARGDFNRWSDIDVVVVADHLPAGWLDRLDALGPRPGLVQPVAWTPSEWRRQLERGNPLAREGVRAGVWLAGSAETLASSGQPAPHSGAAPSPG